MRHKDTSKHRRKQTIPSLARQRANRQEKIGTRMNTDEHGFFSRKGAKVAKRGLGRGLRGAKLADVADSL